MFLLGSSTSVKLLTRLITGSCFTNYLMIVLMSVLYVSSLIGTAINMGVFVGMIICLNSLPWVMAHDKAMVCHRGCLFAISGTCCLVLSRPKLGVILEVSLYIYIYARVC